MSENEIDDKLRAKEETAARLHIKARVLWEDSRRLTKNERLRALSAAESELQRALFELRGIDTAKWPVIAASLALVLAEMGALERTCREWSGTETSEDYRWAESYSHRCVESAQEVAKMVMKHPHASEEVKAAIRHLVELEVFGGPQ